MIDTLELTLWGIAIVGAWSLRRRPALSLAVTAPWALLLLLAGAGRMERYWWLWAALAVLVMAALQRLPKWPRIVVFAVLFGIILAAPVFVDSALGNETAFTRVLAALRDGYGGVPLPGYQSAAALGQSLQVQGVTSAEVNYDIPTWGFEAPYHALDARYKVGMQYDLLLRLQFGVANINTTPTGTGGGYRIGGNTQP